MRKGIRPQTSTTTVVTEEHREEFSVDLVTRLVADLQPVIQQTITTVIKTSRNDENLTEEIISVLSPKILRTIRADVKSDSSYDESQINRLHKTLIVSIRPIIDQTIRGFR